MPGNVKHRVEWIEDERGGGFMNPLATGSCPNDDIDGTPLVVPGEVFHCRTIHVANPVAAANGVLLYESPLAAGNLRRRFHMAASTTLEVTGIIGLRFHTTVIVAVSTTSSMVFVHVGGVSRLN